MIDLIQNAIFLKPLLTNSKQQIDCATKVMAAQNPGYVCWQCGAFSLPVTTSEAARHPLHWFLHVCVSDHYKRS